MRNAVLATASPALAVMTSSDVEITEVEVHADVLAFVEAYTERAGTAMPWAALLAAAGAVPPDHPLLRIGQRHGRGVAASVSDAVSDLMKLGLLVTGTDGLRITEDGCAAVRKWNGAYKDRLAAAADTLGAANLLPRQSDA